MRSLERTCWPVCLTMALAALSCAGPPPPAGLTSAPQRSASETWQLHFIAIAIDDGIPVIGTSDSLTLRLCDTPLETLEAPWREIKTVEMSEDRKKAKVTFRSGDVLHGALGVDELSLETDIGTISVSVAHIVSIAVDVTMMPVRNPNNGHWYALIEDEQSWEEARIQSERLFWRGMQGHLATLTTPEENSWVLENLEARDERRRWWAGGFQYTGREPGGTWQWITQEPWSWTNWYTGVPDDRGFHGQDHLVFDDQEGYWDDYLGAMPLPYVVEFEPEAGAAVTESPVGFEWVDLLELADPATHSVAGNWKLIDGRLVSDETGAARMALGCRAPPEYEFLVDFTVEKPSACVAQLVSRGKTPFAWSMNAGRPPGCRIEDINGHSVIGNPTRTPHDFEPGKHYISIVRVKDEGVTCLINDFVIAEHKTDYSDLSRNTKWTMGDELLLAVGAYNGPITFHRIAIRAIGG